MLDGLNKFEENLADSLSESLQIDPTVNQLEQDQQLKDVKDELRELKSQPIIPKKDK